MPGGLAVWTELSTRYLPAPLVRPPPAADHRTIAGAREFPGDGAPSRGRPRETETPEAQLAVCSGGRRREAECCMQHVARVACNTSCNTTRRGEPPTFVRGRTRDSAPERRFSRVFESPCSPVQLGKRLAL